MCISLVLACRFYLSLWMPGTLKGLGCTVGSGRVHFPIRLGALVMSERDCPTIGTIMIFKVIVAIAARMDSDVVRWNANLLIRILVGK